LIIFLQIIAIRISIFVPLD